MRKVGEVSPSLSRCLSPSHTHSQKRLAMKFKMKVIQQLHTKVKLELSLSLAMFAFGALSLALFLSLCSSKKHSAVLTCCCQVATFASICFVFCAIAPQKVCYTHCPPAPSLAGLAPHPYSAVLSVPSLSYFLSTSTTHSLDHVSARTLTQFRACTYAAHSSSSSN